MKTVVPTFLDRAVAAVAPAAGLRRLMARQRWEIATQAGAYKGAARDRRGTQNWIARGGDPDADLLPDLATLRGRSRDLIRNAPIATSAIATAVTNTIGTGLRANPRIDREALGIDDATADKWERAAASVWCGWADTEAADATREQSFDGLQELAFRASLESGDVFLIKRFIEGPAGGIGYCLQAVEADRISNPGWKADGAILPSGNTVAGGIERNADGETVAYHVASVHPGALPGSKSATWAGFPARTPSGQRAVLHIYRRLRPGQSRGVPYLAPVIEALKEIDRYIEAERMRAVVSALFTVFVKTTTGDPDGPVEPTEITGGSASDKDLRLGSGAIKYLAPDEDVTFADPKSPNAQFEGFVHAMAEQIGAAIEIPAELLLKRFTASYSASRAALLEAWKFFRARRAWLARQLCQPVYDDVMTEAIARGMLDAPGFFDSPELRRAWLGCAWIGPAPGQLDPYKEAQAAQLLIAEELSTREEQTAAITGGDWEDNHRQRAKEERMRKADGLIPAPPAAPGQIAPPSDDPADDEETPPAEPPEAREEYEAGPPINVHVTVPPREPKRATRKTITTRKDEQGNLVATVVEE